MNDLITAIEDYENQQRQPETFAWTATAEQPSPRSLADESHSSNWKIMRHYTTLRLKLSGPITTMFQPSRSRPPSWTRWAAVAVVAVVAVSMAKLSTAEPGSSVNYRQIVLDEGYWVSTAQLTCSGAGSGAIAETRVIGPGKVSIHPYEANLGARAMVAAGPRYLPMAKRYIQWYLNHLNSPDQYGFSGTMYDYDYDPATCVGTYQPDPRTGKAPKYDSTDAYAGTFLSLVRHYAEANPADSSFLHSEQITTDLQLIADVITATGQPNGLTWATPSYPAQYLLDNVEAQRGLQDYAWYLANVLGDRAAATRRASQAALIRHAIETQLWQASRTPGMYGWAADQLSPSWANWYPDTIAQLWPVWDLLGPSARRSATWRKFASRWPTWVSSTPSFKSSGVGHDPNSHVAYAAARVGDRAALDDYLSRSKVNWIDVNRPAPWTVADSGFRALAALTGATLQSHPSVLFSWLSGLVLLCSVFGLTARPDLQRKTMIRLDDRPRVFRIGPGRGGPSPVPAVTV